MIHYYDGRYYVYDNEGWCLKVTPEWDKAVSLAPKGFAYFDKDSAAAHAWIDAANKSRRK